MAFGELFTSTSFCLIQRLFTVELLTRMLGEVVHCFHGVHQFDLPDVVVEARLAMINLCVIRYTYQLCLNDGLNKASASCHCH